MHKNWVFNTVKSIQFGAGALKQLGVLSKSSKRILVVTDPGILANTSFIDEVKSLCIAAGVEMGVFSKVMADPTEAIVLEATAAAVDYKATAIVGLGGGSSLDVAKLVSVLAMGTQKLSDIFGVGNV